MIWLFEPNRRPRPGGFLAARRGESRRDQAGFTLLELLVVMVILGLLGGLVGPQVLSYIGSSRTKTAQLQIQQLSAALDLYRLDLRTYPTTQQGLHALVAAPTGLPGWNGPYLAKGVVPVDPWGIAYNYRAPGQHGAYDLWSLGADNRDGGDGEAKDVTSW